jgi:GDP-L-fucose synthase
LKQEYISIFQLIPNRSKMRILVTGATGFLGSALCKRLINDGHQLTSLSSRDADLTKQGSLNRFNAQFDVIWHLAAWTQAGDFCLKHPGEQWIINQLINTNVLEWWSRHQPNAKLITIGTSCAYSPDLPLVEENYLLGNPIESLFTYAHTKRMMLVGQMALQRQFGLKWLTLVPSTLYGPGYHTDGRQMHFIFDLVRKILRGKEFGEPVILWGDGYQKRELVHVDDFTSVGIGLANKYNNEVVNIGAGVEYSIRDFAEIICNKVGYPASLIQYDTTRYVGAKSKCLNPSKLNKLLPGKDWKDLEYGITEIVRDFVGKE